MLNEIIIFILGSWFGACVGIFVMAMCKATGEDADERW